MPKGEMTAEVKLKLAAAAAAKRRVNPKPADVPAAEWAIACDFAKEKLGEPAPGAPATYLRWVRPEALAALRSALPHREQVVWAGPRSPGRMVTVFSRLHLEAALKYLKLDAGKYLAALSWPL